MSTSYPRHDELHWECFRKLDGVQESYDDFTIASQPACEDKLIKAATLKIMGKECSQILSCLELTDADKEIPSKIFKKLDDYFVTTLNDETPESDEAIYTVEHVGAVKHNCKGQFFVPLWFHHELGSTTINCRLDMRATCNVISLEDACTILHANNPSLHPKATQLRCYDNSVINTLGHTCSYHDKTSS